MATKEEIVSMILSMIGVSIDTNEALRLIEAATTFLSLSPTNNENQQLPFAASGVPQHLKTEGGLPGVVVVADAGAIRCGPAAAVVVTQEYLPHHQTDSLSFPPTGIANGGLTSHSPSSPVPHAEPVATNTQIKLEDSPEEETNDEDRYATRYFWPFNNYVNPLLRLTPEDHEEIERDDLLGICSYSLKHEECPSGRACRLRKICHFRACPSPRSCRRDHTVVPTCHNIINDGNYDGNCYQQINNPFHACYKDHNKPLRLAFNEYGMDLHHPNRLRASG